MHQIRKRISITKYPFGVVCLFFLVSITTKKFFGLVQKKGIWSFLLVLFSVHNKKKRFFGLVQKQRHHAYPMWFTSGLRREYSISRRFFGFLEFFLLLFNETSSPQPFILQICLVWSCSLACFFRMVKALARGHYHGQVWLSSWVGRYSSNGLLQGPYHTLLANGFQKRTTRQNQRYWNCYFYIV